VINLNPNKPKPELLKETDKSFFGSSVCGLSTSRLNPQGLSSQSLLKNINQQTVGKNINDVDLIKNILSYLNSCGGRASSQQIVEYFKPQLPPNSSLLFKKMLQQLANFQKSEGVWVIKSGFQ